MQTKLTFTMDVTPTEALILAEVMEQGSISVLMSEDNLLELQESAATLRKWGHSQLTTTPA